ncbi:TonB-dependent receptor plug domain-containing protein, partial [Acetomicrobium sp. S15 = DSM 107314]|uniref:TonB-dependent receptor plug domain-containing protein n=1 Tax=Acetomicrobium sp. S15 = DSM 107314 TaxID=2529858 RepID=UPI0018E1C7E1
MRAAKRGIKKGKQALAILVDGVPYYNATYGAGAAAYDLRSIPVDDIERIEVVKGAGSALYGS